MRWPVKRCTVCRSTRPMHGYMVHDHVWRAAGLDGADLAHLACLHRRRVARGGRPLRPDDLTDAPINEPLRWIAILARAEERTPKETP